MVLVLVLLSFLAAVCLQSTILLRLRLFVAFRQLQRGCQDLCFSCSIIQQAIHPVRRKLIIRLIRTLLFQSTTKRSRLSWVGIANVIDLLFIAGILMSMSIPSHQDKGLRKIDSTTRLYVVLRQNTETSLVFSLPTP
jgi:hypothetical protein